MVAAISGSPANHPIYGPGNSRSGKGEGIMKQVYDPASIEIWQLDLIGTRINRVHGKEFRVRPRFYSVRDKNLHNPGTWIVELH